MKLLINIVIILCLLLLSSCGPSKLQPLNNSAKTRSIETVANSTNRDAYTIKSDTYTKLGRNSNIVINYPTLQGKGFENSNELIKSTIRNLVPEIYGIDYFDLDLEMDYKISFQNNSFISIVFEGMGYVKTAAHPNHLFITLNINVKNGTQIKLSDMYTINDNFKEIYFETAKKQAPERFTKEEWLSLIEELEKDSSTNWYFEHADSINGLQSYLTQNGLGLSMPVQFALGNHFEILIPYSKITQYLKFNQTLLENL